MSKLPRSVPSAPARGEFRRSHAYNLPAATLCILATVTELQAAAQADDLLDDDDNDPTATPSEAAQPEPFAPRASKAARAARAALKAAPAAADAKATGATKRPKRGAKSAKAAPVQPDADSDEEEAAAIAEMKDPASKKAALKDKRSAEKAGLEVVRQVRPRVLCSCALRLWPCLAAGHLRVAH